MILTYLYDGSFEGYMTCVYDSFYNKEKVEEIASALNFERSLVHDCRNISTDNVKAVKVVDAIEKKISNEALENVYYAFLSSIPGSGTLIFQYIKLGFKLGKEIDLHLHNDIVLNVHKIFRKVTYETHNMLGFIRFKKTGNNLYYSSIEPDHDILGLVAPHFSDRLSDENWIIHDLKREIAVFYNRKEWIIVPFPKEKSAEFNSRNDNFYEDLWVDYFNTLAIEERRNPRLQRQHMPSRYWKHLVEMKK